MQSLDDIKNGTLDIDVVVVYKLDRFFRNEKLSHDFICVNIYKVLKNNFGYAEPYSEYTVWTCSLILEIIALWDIS